MGEIKMESKHLMIIGIIGLFFLQNIILLEPQSHTNNNMDKIIFNNVSPSQLYYSYNISIHNSPSGNGYYQQLITLKNYSIYNINSNGSNFYVAYENNTLIYSWIQNINKTVITLWSKILNGTSEIKIDVYNNKTNLFSSNGHIGIADTSTDNGILVFNTPSSYYADLYGTSSPNIYYSPSPPVNITQDNGLRFHNTSSLYNVYLNRQFNGSVTTYFYVSGFSGSLDVALVYKNTSSGSQTLLTTTKTGLYSLSNNTYISTVRFVENNNAIGYENITYWFVVPEITMPTFTTSTQIMFTYHIQIKSFNNQNIIKNCFKYNNNVYNSITNTFIFSNSSKFIFSILPQNYTILNTSYLTNTSIINIKQNQYTSANFINYYYNISISYFSKTSTPINYYSPPNYYFTIGIIIFLLIGGLIIYTKIRNGD